jgi:hypothetical protein
VELGAGVLFTALAGLFAQEGQRPPTARASPRHSACRWSSSAACSVGLGGAAKERLTYPRTGYVTLPPGRHRVLAAPAPASAWRSSGCSPPDNELALGALQGVKSSFSGLSLRTGLVRLAVVGIVALGGGLVATTLGLGASLGSALAFGAAGVAAVLSGAWALSHYLRTTASPTEGA